MASKLPHVSGNPIIPDDLKTIEIFFDFGDFMPDAFFTFVLARCQNYSKLQFQTDEQTYIYKKGGFFVGDNSFGSSCYWLHREIMETNAATQKLIRLTVPHSSCDRVTIIFERVWKVIDDLRKQQFKSVHFHCGPLCPFDSPHANTKGKRHHVLEVARDGQEEFEVPKTLRCLHRTTDTASLLQVCLHLLLFQIHFVMKKRDVLPYESIIFIESMFIRQTFRQFIDMNVKTKASVSMISTCS